MSTREDWAADAFDSRWDYAEEPGSKKEADVCPECGCGEVCDKIRQYPDQPGTVDVGYECENCGWQWGFAMSKPGPREGKP